MIFAEGELGPWSAVLPSLGPTAGVIVSVIYFLKYMAGRDIERRDEAIALAATTVRIADEGRKHVESLKLDFMNELRENRALQRQITDSLFAISKDTVAAMTALSQRVSDLGEVIQELRAVVGQQQNRPDYGLRRAPESGEK